MFIYFLEQLDNIFENKLRMREKAVEIRKNEEESVAGNSPSALEVKVLSSPGGKGSSY